MLLLVHAVCYILLRFVIITAVCGFWVITKCKSAMAATLFSGCLIRMNVHWYLIRKYKKPSIPIFKISHNTGKELHWVIFVLCEYSLRCEIFGFVSSFPQNKRKIYKLRQLSLSDFVYFWREACLLFIFWMIKFTIMSKNFP